MATKTLVDAGFSGRILDPTSPDFAHVSRRFSAFAERKARYIVFPKSAQDISHAITFAKQQKLKFAIKSGGHNPSGGNSSEDGLVLDLGDLKIVKFDRANMVVRVGGGCLWGDVYSVLRDENVVCVGGVVHSVGVGGQLTGGGYGPLTQKFGMACDNLVSATVVLADGSIVNASETEHADLLWAIKGSSSQFGVVAEFVLRTYPDQGTWFYRFSKFPGTALECLPDLVREFFSKEHEKVDVIFPFIGFYRGPAPNREPYIGLTFMGIGPISRHKQILEPFFERIKPFQDNIQEFPSLAEFGHCLDKFLVGGNRIVTGGAPFTFPWPGMIEDCYKLYIDYTDSHPDAKESKVMIEMHGTKRYRPHLSSFHVAEPMQHMTIFSNEHHAVDGDQAAHDWVNQGLSLVRRYQTQYGGEDLGVNGNACMRDQTNSDVYGKSYPKLQRVKAKYDPDCVFKGFFPIEPTGHANL